MALHLTYDPVGGKLGGNVRSLGAPLAGAFLLHLAHPTRPEKDLQLTLQTDRDGNFSVALPMLELARWQVQLENAGRDWRVAGVWLWPHQRNVDLVADTPVAD